MEIFIWHISTGFIFSDYVSPQKVNQKIMKLITAPGGFAPAAGASSNCDRTEK
jgi:hypothetical protein